MGDVGAILLSLFLTILVYCGPINLIVLFYKKPIPKMKLIVTVVICNAVMFVLFSSLLAAFAERGPDGKFVSNPFNFMPCVFWSLIIYGILEKVYGQKALSGTGTPSDLGKNNKKR